MSDRPGPHAPHPGLAPAGPARLGACLLKLEKDGLIEGVWSEEGPRGKRKRYALTARGRRFAQQQRESWRTFLDRFGAAIGKEEA